MRTPRRTLAQLEASPAVRARIGQLFRENSWHAEAGLTEVGTFVKYAQALRTVDAGGGLEAKERPLKELAAEVFARSRGWSSPLEVERTLQGVYSRTMTDGILDDLAVGDAYSERHGAPERQRDVEARRDAASRDALVDRAFEAHATYHPPKASRGPPTVGGPHSTTTAQARPGMLGIGDAVDAAFAAHKGEAAPQVAESTPTSLDDAVDNAWATHATEAA